MPRQNQDQMSMLLKILARFKLHELKDIIAQRFPSIEWEEILNDIKENLEPLNSKTAAQHFVLHLEERKFTRNEIDQIIDKFMITEISLHSQKRKWRACNLTGDGSERPIGIKSLRSQVIDNCQQASINVAVSVLHRDSKYWLLLKEKKPPPKRKSKKRQEQQPVQYKSPVFMAASVGEPYLFIPHRYFNEKIVESVSCALKYPAFQFLPLSDNKIDGMLEALRSLKRKAVGIARLPDQSFECAPVAYLPGGGIDFTQRSERQRYVNEYFGEKPPVKKTISFVMQNKLITDDIPNREELKNLVFPVTVTITSDNVWSTLKNLIVEGVIEFPPPAFYHKAILQAKDNVKLKAYIPKSQSSHQG